MSENINKVGVVGAGTMGIGICEVAASQGCEVLLYDTNQEQAQKGLEQVKERLKKRAFKGKITQHQVDQVMDNITLFDDLAHFSACDLVVEAVVEDLAVKQEIFSKLEVITSSLALLATNTSSISITAIAAAMKDPSRLFGLHFFNPAPVMKLVEVISGLQTDPAHLDAAKQLCRAWKKIPVLAQSTPGFVVNRVARPFYGESLKMLQEQMAPHHQLDAILTQAAGFRMGPFALMDLIGIDINYAVSQTVYQAMYNDPKYRPSLLQGEMVSAGLLGKKTGHGFYSHADGAGVPKPDLVFSDADFDEIRVPEEVTYFSEMFCEFEHDNRKWQGEDVIIGGCLVQMTDGRLAAAVETDRKMPVCLVDLSFDYMKAKAVNLTFSPGANEFMRNRVIAVFNHIKKDVMVSADQPGMVAMRVIAMLVNEAADAVFNGVCSERDVDLAMKYGVNYPQGLLAFAEQLGWSHVAAVLEQLHSWFGDDRYRLSPHIRKKL